MTDSLAGIALEMRAHRTLGNRTAELDDWAARIAALEAGAGGVVVAYQYYGTLTLAADADEFMRGEGTPLYAAAPKASEADFIARQHRLPEAMDRLMSENLGDFLDTPQADPAPLEWEACPNCVRGNGMRQGCDLCGGSGSLQADPAPPVAARCNSSVLRAMANNYRDGHSWDHLDGEACIKAADEIDDHARMVAEKGAKAKRDYDWITDLLAENAALRDGLAGQEGAG